VGLLFKNNAETTLSGGINDSVTTIPVTSAAVFPTPNANNVFFATIDDGTNVEVVKVTGISSNDLTVVREQDNTSASAFSSGTTIELRLNAKVLDMGTASLTDLDGDTVVLVEESADEDKIKFKAAGTEVMRIDSTGIGIGGVNATEKITVDGNIANSSGDMLIDVAADLTLDADGEHIRFKDGGTEIGNIDMGSHNLNIRAVQSDKDILLLVNDGGSEVTALLLDGSDAGTAIFNHDVRVGDNSFFICGAGDDVAIASDGTNGTISAGNGNLTLDVEGNITLDANGGVISLQDNGVETGQLKPDSAGLVLQAVGSDLDIFLSGSDGGSAITAVRVDMSDAGAIICNGNITAFGSTSDIKLKENIEVIPDALDKVKQLKGVTFNYKKDGKISTGLIAQDLEKVLPEAVYESSDVDDDEDKHLAIRYGNTVGLLVEAIKELEARVKELEAK